VKYPPFLQTLSRRLLDRGLVVASGRSERDIEPVPPVDSNDAQRKLRELLFTKFFQSLAIGRSKKNALGLARPLDIRKAAPNVRLLG
jgi:hypothetical protein